MKNPFYAALVSTAVALAPTLAWSYDINLGPFGHACDTCGGGVVGGLPVIGHAVNEAQAQANGALLEQWIIASHNTAVSGAMLIPPLIRQALTGYASEDSMNRVRYKIGDSGFLNLADVIEKGGRVQAVTLIDVIIFRGPSEAGDPSLWANELTHVDQYRDWGVHSFAIQYARDYNTVEAPAYAKGDGYSTWAQNHGVQNQGSPPTASMGRFCVTNYARDIGQLQPVGSPCSNSVNPAYQFTPAHLGSWVQSRHNRGFQFGATRGSNELCAQACAYLSAHFAHHRVDWGGNATHLINTRMQSRFGPTGNEF